MGRYLNSSCKQCRREGMKLMLKGIRCETAKCPIEKKQRNIGPGMHGWRKAAAVIMVFVYARSRKLNDTMEYLIDSLCVVFTGLKK
jgi:hypothetical protein